MSPDLHELFDAAGRTPPRSPFDIDDVVRRGAARRRRRRAVTVTASGAAAALVLVGGALLTSPARQAGEPPAGSSRPPTPGPSVSSTPTVATPAPGTPSASASTAPAHRACTATDITLGLGSSGVAMGTWYRTVVASVRSGVSCSLEGYPTVTVANSGGTVVGTAAVHNQVTQAHRVILGPGHASFLVGFADTANFDPEACSPVPVTTLRVRLSGAPTAISLRLPSGTLTCSRDVSALGAVLTAGPWVTGATGQ